MSRVVLLVDDPAVERRVREALGDDRFRREIAVVRPDPVKGADVMAKLVAGYSPDLVLVAPTVPLDEGIDLSAAIDREHPEVTVVLVFEPSPALWELAARAGVRDILSPESRPAVYRKVIDQALQVADRRRSNIIELTESRKGTDGRIITVVSPKGGAGKTTVATNLAIGLARQAPDEVVIVDLDLQFGDVGAALQLTPELTFADLVPGETVHDPANVKLLLAHHPERLFALCAPDHPAAAEDVRADDIGPLLRTLAADFRYVIVDTCAGIDAPTLAALDVSTDLVLVGAMDVPTVRSLRKCVDALDHLGMTEARRLVVLNRSDSRVDLNTDDVAGAIGLRIAVSIPSSRSVPLSVNHGCPVLLFDPRSPVIRPLQELVSLLSDDEPIVAETESRSLFRRGAR
jgi:pilus assembly protein CpaE